MAETDRKSYITKAGLDLYSKIQTGSTPLTITRVAVGDGTYSEQEILSGEMTALKSPVKIDTSIEYIRATGNGEAILSIGLSASERAFYLREIGVYASDPDVGEILYSYCSFGNTADYIESYNGLYSVFQRADIYIKIGNATDIRVDITDRAYATPEELRRAASVVTSMIYNNTATDGYILKITVPDMPADPYEKGNSDSLDGKMIAISIGNYTATSDIANMKLSVNNQVTDLWKFPIGKKGDTGKVQSFKAYEVRPNSILLIGIKDHYGYIANTPSATKLEGKIKDAAANNTDYTTAGQVTEYVSDEIENHREAEVLDHPDGSVTEEKISPLAVTEEKIADGVVTSGKIADYAVRNKNLADGAVNWDKLDIPTQEEIDNKAYKYHSHGDSEITDIDASKIKSGVIDIARIPPAALERLINVTNKTARFALTKGIAQKGDTVKELDSGLMYIVIDDSKLDNEAGYTEYTAGRAASVAWTGVTEKPAAFPPDKHTHEIKDVELLDDRFNSSKSIRVFNTNPDDLSVATFRDDTRYISSDGSDDRTQVPDAAGYVLKATVNPLTWARGVEWQYSDQIVLNIDNNVDYNDSDQYLIITYDFNTSICSAEFTIDSTKYNVLPTYNGAGIMTIKGGRWKFDLDTSKWVSFPEGIIRPGYIGFPYGYGTWVDPFVVSDPKTDLATLTTPGIYYFDFNAEIPIMEVGDEQFFVSHCYMTVQPANDKNNNRHIIQKIKMYVSDNEEVYEIERELVNGISSAWYILRGPINSYVNIKNLINRVIALENAIKSLTGNSPDGTIDENTTLTAATAAEAEDVLKKYFS